MTGDDDFTPRLGRIRDRGQAGGRRFSKRVRAAARGVVSKRKGPKFTGRHNGRGGPSARRLMQARVGRDFSRTRRVIVKVHIARAAKGGAGAYRAHLHYIQRDGAGRDGRGGEIYAREGETPDVDGFLGRSEEDRHQFRFIVSPEDSDQLGELKETTRALIARMETDLGTRLDWLAVDHHNTGHPHTHVVVRGRDARGADLVIAPDYIASGLRHRAEDIVTETLGPRRDIEIARARAAEVSRDRVTAIDRALMAEAQDNTVRLDGAIDTPGDRFDQGLKRRRLAHLESLGLAEDKGGDRWVLKSGWTRELDTLGRRNDVIRTLAREFGRRESDERLKTFGAREAARGPLLGSVVMSVPDDELRGSRSIVVEDFSGERWLVSLGAAEPGTLPPAGAVVEIARAEPQARTSDRVIAEIAGQTGGVYSDAFHRDADPCSTAAYRLSHTRRLEALRRAGVLDRLGDGTWTIPEDYLTKAADFEGGRRGGLDVRVRAWIAIEDQIERKGLTWLDDGSEDAMGARISKARASRLAWLRGEGFVAPDAERLTLDASTRFAQREEAGVSARLAAQSARVALALAPGDTLDGVYEGAVDLGNRRLAIIGNAREFALVPWRADIERHRGRALEVQRTASGLSWTIGMGRDRGLSR